ncbi:MAG: hypothetical protein R8G01_14675 [Ilumatobacteraceae bacterium]|nr:hypothetical protein [Ilumatobacteraceae bacterium]
MAEDHDDPLVFSEQIESTLQIGLDPRCAFGGRFLTGQRHNDRLSANGVRAHPIQIPDRVRHIAHTIPVLPAVRERINRRLATTLGAVPGDERPSQSRFCIRDERVEADDVLDRGIGASSHHRRKGGEASNVSRGKTKISTAGVNRDRRHGQTDLSPTSDPRSTRVDTASQPSIDVDSAIRLGSIPLDTAHPITSSHTPPSAIRQQTVAHRFMREAGMPDAVLDHVIKLKRVKQIRDLPDMIARQAGV